MTSKPIAPSILVAILGGLACIGEAHATPLGLPLVANGSVVPLCNDAANACTGATYTTGASSPAGDENRVFKYFVQGDMVDAPIVVVLHGGVSAFPYENTLLTSGGVPAYLGRLATQYTNTAFVAIRGNTPTNNPSLIGHRYIQQPADANDAETYRDVKFIRQVLEDLRDTFPGYVSDTEAYLVGFSAGAGLVETALCVDGVGYSGFAMMGLPFGEARSVDCGNTLGHAGYTALTGDAPHKYGALDPYDPEPIRRGKIYFYIGLADDRINQYDVDSTYRRGLFELAKLVTDLNGVKRSGSYRAIDTSADGLVTEVREFVTPAAGEIPTDVRPVRIAFTDNSAAGYYSTRAGRAFSNPVFPSSLTNCVNVTPACTPQELGLVQNGGGHAVPDALGPGTSDFDIVDELADFFGWN